MRGRGLAGAALLMALALQLSCAHRRRPPFETTPDTTFTNQPASKSQVIVTPGQSGTGRIVAVNPAVRYVVITYGVGTPLPSVGSLLGVYRAGLKVAELKISGPSRDSNTVGDIVTGECQVGDEVRQE